MWLPERKVSEQGGKNSFLKCNANIKKTGFTGARWCMLAITATQQVPGQPGLHEILSQTDFETVP